MDRQKWQTLQWPIVLLAGSMAFLPTISNPVHSQGSTSTLLRDGIPPRGQVELIGKVQRITASRRLVMTVTRVVMSNGQTADLSPPRTKQIMVDEGTPLHIRGNTQASVPFDDLTAGMSVIAVGDDVGVGLDMPARHISVWTGAKAGSYLFSKPASETAGT